jgi:hypothetical protein
VTSNRESSGVDLEIFIGKHEWVKPRSRRGATSTTQQSRIKRTFLAEEKSGPRKRAGLLLFMEVELAIYDAKISGCIVLPEGELESAFTSDLFPNLIVFRIVCPEKDIVPINTDR